MGADHSADDEGIADVVARMLLRSIWDAVT